MHRVLAGRDYTGGERDREVPRFLDAARDAIGVLVEQSPDRFGFLHLTFQEFLAARAIVKRVADAPCLIAQFWDHPDWREVWLLYALGCQGQQTRFASLCEIVLSAASRHRMDRVLRRPERQILRLCGVGSETLPASAAPALDWAVRVLARGPTRDRLVILRILLLW